MSFDASLEDERTIASGPGWRRVAEAVAERVTPEQIETIYVFPPLRRGGREWGTAVVTLAADDDRRRVFHARYWLQIRGRERGRGRVEVEEVGRGPRDVIPTVVSGVQRRAGDLDPAIEIDPRWWYEG